MDISIQVIYSLKCLNLNSKPNPDPDPDPDLDPDLDRDPYTPNKYYSFPSVVNFYRTQHKNGETLHFHDSCTLGMLHLFRAEV